MSDRYVVDAVFEFGWQGHDEYYSVVSAMEDFTWDIGHVSRDLTDDWGEWEQELADLEPRVVGPHKGHRNPYSSPQARARVSYAEITPLPDRRGRELVLWDGQGFVQVEINANSAEEAIDYVDFLLQAFAFRQCGDCYAQVIR